MPNITGGQSLSGTGGSAAPGTLTKIASQTLGAPAATVSFAAISAGYTSLQLIYSAGSSNAVTTNVTIQVNGLSTAIYSYTFTYQNFNSASPSSATSQTSAFIGSVSSSGAGTNVGSGIIDFPFYSNTTLNKSFFSQSISTDPSSTTIASTIGGSIALTAAISSIVISCGGNFSTGSQFTLYGIS